MTSTEICALTDDLQAMFGELFILMQQAQQAAMNEETQAEALRMNADVARKMQLADARLRIFLAGLNDASEADRERVNAFLAALEAGLSAMLERLQQYSTVLHKEQRELGDSIRFLHKNRIGMRGYRPETSGA